MKKLFQKIQVELLKQPTPRKKRRSLLYAIGGGRNVNKLGQKLPPPKKRRLSKKFQKEEYERKRKLNKANKYWNDWKFNMHRNKVEWVNPRSRDERKNPFCVSSKKS